MVLSFIGLDSLDENEVNDLKTYSDRFYQKVSRTITTNTDPLVILHVKKMKASGRRCKYSIHGKVESPKLLTSVEYSDWDLIRALTKTFEKMESEIAHKFKTQGKNERVSFKKAIKESAD
ncbi:MAG: hypothetical protein AABW58_04615 [Nanoarchaeota archaeon]